MTGRDLAELDALHDYLAEVSAFLREEKRRLERWRSGELARDERLTSDALRPLAEDLPRLLEATTQVESWLPQLESSFGALRDELDTLRQEHTQLAALYDVGQVINSTLDLAQVMELSMDQIVEVTRAERGFLMLMDRETGALTFEVARNMDRRTIEGPSFEISRSIVKGVARDGVPVLTTNAQVDPRFRDQSSVVGFNLRSILCVPLMVKRVVTGVVYVDNRIRTGVFTAKDRDLLVTFANQAAVAIENARLFEGIRQKMDEISTIKRRMDNIFASITSGIVTTDTQGLVTTVNRAAERILRVSSSEAVGSPYGRMFPLPHRSSLGGLIDGVVIGQASRAGREVECDVPRRGRVTLSLSASRLRDASDRTLGAAVVIDDLTERKRLEEERDKEQRERVRTRQVRERYVHPAVVERLLSNPEELRLGGTKRELTILFADLGGLSSLAGKVPAEELVDTLNSYLAVAAEAVLSHGGMLDKFLGDAVMALFNWPERQEDHCVGALRAAVSLVEGASGLATGSVEGPPLSFRVGVSVGEAVVGNVGIPQRSDYTAIGDSVNLAKRLQEHAQPGQILISRSAYEMARDLIDTTPLEPTAIKGHRGLERVYELSGLRHPRGERCVGETDG
jgi:adenylate cyclase